MADCQLYILDFIWKSAQVAPPAWYYNANSLTLFIPTFLSSERTASKNLCKCKTQTYTCKYTHVHTDLTDCSQSACERCPVIALNSLLQVNKDKALLNATLLLVNGYWKTRQCSRQNDSSEEEEREFSLREHVSWCLSVLRFPMHTEVEMMNDKELN